MIRVTSLLLIGLPQGASEAYNTQYRGETGTEIRYAAVRQSCSPRLSGRSAFMEVRP